MTDLAAARTFMATTARLLERRRFAHLVDGGPPELVLSALAAHRNPDGGFGMVDPDVRTATSQPSALRYALEALADLPPSDDARALAMGAFDWLQTVTADDGSVPFVLPTAADGPHAPWFDPTDATPSLLMTAQLAAAGHRLELDHPWLGPATAYCWGHVAELDPSQAYTFAFVVDLLDVVPDRARADAAIDVLADRVPADGRIVVTEGVEGEELDPLDVAPWPEHAGARLFDDAVLERAAAARAEGQRDDGGWDFTWLRWTEAGTCEWRGLVTVNAVRTLRAYGRL